jgi:hypothetical protein
METKLFIALGLVCCLALSFVLSGMEAGVFALSRLRIRQQMRAGNASARVLHQFLENPENFLWTIVVGNTLVNFVVLGLVFLDAVTGRFRCNRAGSGCGLCWWCRVLHLLRSAAEDAVSACIRTGCVCCWRDRSGDPAPRIAPAGGGGGMVRAAVVAVVRGEEVLRSSLWQSRGTARKPMQESEQACSLPKNAR